jgi:SAM-dependent methyltransferase
VRSNRAFLGRAVRFLAGEAGITQFLDVGTGIPTASNTHEVAQSVNPLARVVYVDNDPMVLTHARALLTSVTAPTAYVDADARDTGKLLAEAARTLDFTKPVALMLIGLLHCIPDADDPHRVVAELVSALPPGSYLAISHPAAASRQLALRPAELVEQRPVALHHQPQVLGVLAARRGRTAGGSGGARRAAFPHHAQLPLPLPQRADQRLRRLLDQVGGVADGLPGVIDEPRLCLLPPCAQPGRFAEQRLVQVSRGRQRALPRGGLVDRHGVGRRSRASVRHSVRFGGDAIVRPEN